MSYQPTQLAEKTGFVSTTPLGAGATFSSGPLDANGWSQVQTEILADKDGTITINFCSDAGGTDIVRSLTIPYTASSGYQFFAAPAFGNYIEYKYTNGATAQGDFYYTTKFLSSGLNPQVLRTDGFISPSMVAQLNRSVIVGSDSNGNFQNSSVTQTINDSGTYYNLNVVSGARPSQLAGRVSVQETVDISANTLIHTVTTNKTYYVTDLILTIDNSSTTASGRLNIRNGTTVAGTIILPILAQEAPTSETAITTIQYSFNEPLPFTTGVFFELAAGTLDVAGIIIGYEE